MQPLEWTNDDFVYVEPLDADHQKVFEDAETLRHAIALSKPVSELGSYLWRLSRSFSTHLTSEERLMRTSRYPGFQWHQRQHQAGLKKMALLTQAVHGNDEIALRDSFRDFARWMMDHIHLADQMFASHLRNDQRERLAS